MLAVVVSTMLTSPPPRERWEPFLWSPRMLVKLSGGKARPWFQSLWLWGGIYTAIWIGIYVWFW
jgi:hypothetical protein